MTKDEIQKALNEIPKDGNYDGEYLSEWFYYHQKTVICALQSQLTKTAENVTCKNLSNADDRHAALDKLVNVASNYAPEVFYDWIQETGISLRAALRSPRVPVIEILETVLEQAEDEGLWFNAKYASEAYLQQELRRLHAVIERAYAELQKGV